MMSGNGFCRHRFSTGDGSDTVGAWISTWAVRLVGIAEMMFRDNGGNGRREARFVFPSRGVFDCFQSRMGKALSRYWNGV